MEEANKKSMTFLRFVFQDWKANQGNTKGRVMIILFRIANFFSTREIYFYLGFPYLILYKILSDWIFTTEIPYNVKIGKNLKIFHGQALIINGKTIIGESCTIRQSTTIGDKQLSDGSFSAAPIIGNHVDIGSNCCIIGGIKIEDFVRIGCGAVVVKDVSAYSTVVGNPGIELKRVM